MANDKIRTLTYIRELAPDILEVANRLAELEQRKPHDSIRLLILEAGRNKIAKLEQECQVKSFLN